jgi:hypothetical protein
MRDTSYPFRDRTTRYADARHYGYVQTAGSDLTDLE